MASFLVVYQTLAFDPHISLMCQWSVCTVHLCIAIALPILLVSLMPVWYGFVMCLCLTLNRKWYRRPRPAHLMLTLVHTMGIRPLLQIAEQTVLQTVLQTVTVNNRTQLTHHSILSLIPSTLLFFAFSNVFTLNPYLSIPSIPHNTKKMFSDFSFD